MTGENIEAAIPLGAVTVFPTEPVEAGKGGEGGDFQITNAEFVAAVFPRLPEGAFVAVSSKRGDPGLGSWPASRADLAASSLSADTNNYLGCSSFYPGDDGSFKARKAQFAACHFLMLDDLGTKVPLDRVENFKLSWLIETSPGNHQGGIILAEPLTDGLAAVRLLNAVINAGLCDAGATGPLSRWARPGPDGGLSLAWRRPRNQDRCQVPVGHGRTFSDPRGGSLSSLRAAPSGPPR
jgi:hypothetical protein